jgi:hypothetical protein
MVTAIKVSNKKRALTKSRHRYILHPTAGPWHHHSCLLQTHDRRKEGHQHRHQAQEEEQLASQRTEPGCSPQIGENRKSTKSGTMKDVTTSKHPPRRMKHSVKQGLSNRSALPRISSIKTNRSRRQ